MNTSLYTPPKPLPSNVLNAMRRITRAEYRVYIVGGAVRDMLLECSPKDYDIVTDAPYSELLALFPEGRCINSRTHTLLVSSRTPFVSDVEITPLPTTQGWSRLQAHLLTRDATVNALAWDGTMLYDTSNGVCDVACNVIRAVGDASERIKEDPVRMMRYIRVAAEKGFEIEKPTLAAIEEHASLLSTVAVERVRDELTKILVSPGVAQALYQLAELGLLHEFLPELTPTIGFRQRNKHHDKTIFDHTVKVADSVPAKPIVRLAALFHDIGKPQSYTYDEVKDQGHFYDHHTIGARITEQVMRRLRYPEEEIRRVTILVTNHMIRPHQMGDPATRRLINRVGSDNLADLIHLLVGDIVGAKPPYVLSPVYKLKDRLIDMLIEDDVCKVTDLKISGRDVLESGVPEGPAVGEVLNELLAIVTHNPTVNDRQALLSLLHVPTKRKRLLATLGGGVCEELRA